MVRIIIVIVEVVAYVVMFCFVGWMLARTARSIVRRELEAVWRRLEWLAKDTDDRLSADRVEIQWRGMQIRRVQKRVRRCEKALYINVDGKEADGKEDEGDER